MYIILSGKIQVYIKNNKNIYRSESPELSNEEQECYEYGNLIQIYYYQILLIITCSYIGKRSSLW